LNRYPPGLQRLLEQVHFQFLAGAGQPQNQPRIPRAGRFGKPHAITRVPERSLDPRGDLRQRGVVPGGEVKVLGGTVHDLMGSERVPSGQQQAVPFEDRQAI
jgi:hypothetical protein